MSFKVMDMKQSFFTSKKTGKPLTKYIYTLQDTSTQMSFQNVGAWDSYPTGSVIDGTIEQVQKDGKIYYNFVPTEKKAENDEKERREFLRAIIPIVGQVGFETFKDLVPDLWAFWQSFIKGEQ
jgi:hypothetical protein